MFTARLKAIAYENNSPVLNELLEFIEGNGSFDIKQLLELDSESFSIALGAVNETLLAKRSEEVQVVLNYPEDRFCNQSTFSELCKENGLNYSTGYISIYHKRGYLPPADVVLDDKPYWRKSSILNYIEKRK